MRKFYLLLSQAQENTKGKKSSLSLFWACKLILIYWLVYVAWLLDLSWAAKIVYLFFFQDISRKFLILLLSYFSIFWPQISSSFAIFFSLIIMVFPACTCEPGLRSVSLAQKISARCNTGSYVFSFFFICIFIIFFALLHICFLFPQRVPPDLEGGYEKSILTRTETLFYHYLFQRTRLIIILFLKTICFYLPFISIRIWN